MANLIYFLTPSTTAGFAYELTCRKKGTERREIVNRFPERSGWTIQEVTQNAMGRALIVALQSKHDYGNNTELVIEFEICSIQDPLINL